MSRYFYLEESPYHPNRYTLRINKEKLPMENTEGNFNILPARLIGLSYASYLRMCRDIIGAEIIGKNSNYPVAYFKSKENVLLDILDTKVELILHYKKGLDKSMIEDFKNEYEINFDTAPGELFEVIIKEHEVIEENTK